MQLWFIKAITGKRPLGRTFPIVQTIGFEEGIRETLDLKTLPAGWQMFFTSPAFLFIVLLKG